MMGLIFDCNKREEGGNEGARWKKVDKNIEEKRREMRKEVDKIIEEKGDEKGGR